MLRRLIIGFTIIFTVILIFNIFPEVRGGEGWRWPYSFPKSAHGFFIFPLICAFYLLGVYGLKDQRSWLRVGWVVVWGSLITYGAVAMWGDPFYLLFSHTVAPVSTGAMSVVHQFMPDGVNAEILGNWTEIMHQSYQLNFIHFTTSPPGQPIIHSILAELVSNTSFSDNLSYMVRPLQCANASIMNYSNHELTSAAIIAFTMPILSSLGAIPTFFIVRRLLQSSDLACRTVAWYAIVPTLTLFAPSWNIFYPVLVISSMAFLIYGLPLFDSEKMRPHLLVFSGLFFSLCTLLNFAVLPALLIVGLFALGTVGLKRGIVAGMWYGLGLISCWLVLGLVSGVTPFDIWSVTYKHHREMASRDYFTWVILHPYDTLLFMGWPLVGVFFMAIWQTVKSYRITRTVTPYDVLLISMVIAFTVLNLLGIVQGENGRILSFYAPFIIISTAIVFKHYQPSWEIPLLGAQSLLLWGMAGFVGTMILHLNPMVFEPFADIAQLDDVAMQPAEQKFEAQGRRGEAVLESYRYVADVGEQVITLETLWRGVERFENPYQFQVIATAENSIDGEIITEPQRWYAQHSNYLPTCWRDGDRVRDIHTLHLPTVAEPVVWELELRLFNQHTGEILDDVMRIEGINYP
jgi:hypothetical protein